MRLERTLLDEPPAIVREGGFTRDGVDPALDELKGISRSGRQVIADMEDRERTRTGISSLKVRFNRVFGYYIEISKANLHLVPDEADPYGLVHAYMDSVCPGSHLVITQLTKDIRPEAMARLEKAPPPDARYSFAMRSHAEVSRFFDGLELLEPGVVTVDRWRPDGSPDVGRADGEPVPFYGGIGRKP